MFGLGWALLAVSLMDDPRVVEDAVPPAAPHESGPAELPVIASSVQPPSGSTAASGDAGVEQAASRMCDCRRG
jgi:hypothetical protein